MWLIGVDAGGTNTRAAAAQPESGEIRKGHAPGANWTVHGPELCSERIRAAIGEALPPEAEIGALCVCIAGYYPPDHAAAAREWVSETWPAAQVRIYPDVVAAWAGAHGGEPGVVLVSGTGSICYGRNSAGEEARAGGWGPLFGDQGSAYWIGIRCLQILADQVDWRTGPSELSEALLRRWPELGGDVRSWLRGIYRCGWSREQVAALAAEAGRLADQGDPKARGTIGGAAYFLGQMARAVEAALDPGKPLPLALQGGVAQSCSLVGVELVKFLELNGSRLRLVEARFTPLEGALLLAAESWGGPSALSRLREQLQ